jgi:hypothetical protein
MADVESPQSLSVVEKDGQPVRRMQGASRRFEPKGDVPRPLPSLGRRAISLIVLESDIVLATALQRLADARGATVGLYWSLDELVATPPWAFDVAIVDEHQWARVEAMSDSRIASTLRSVPRVILTRGAPRPGHGAETLETEHEARVVRTRGATEIFAAAVRLLKHELESHEAHLPAPRAETSDDVPPPPPAAGDGER